MTTLDRLLEIGARCPKCGEIARMDHRGFGRYQVVCFNCGACGSFPQTQGKLVAAVGWYVLTGGSISGEVKPPNGERVLCEYATTDEWTTKWRVCRITEGAAFSDGRRQDGYVRWFFIDRDPAIIRSWLESKVTT